MTYKTHFNFGILCCILVLTYIFKTNINLILFLLIGGITALLPDADHHNSKINRIFAPGLYILILFYLVFHEHLYILISSLIWALCAVKSKHRTFTHSILGLIIFCIPFINSIYLIPVIIGYASHLLIDIITNRGIPLLYPLKEPDGKHYIKTNIGFIRTGSKTERIICLLLIIGNIYTLYNLIK